jgi:hypothetical protein
MTVSKKVAIFAFRGEGPCFLHALLNAEDMRNRGLNAVVIMEGGSVKNIRAVAEGTFPVPVDKVKSLVDCACLGCSMLFKVDGLFQQVDIRLEGGMSNHVSITDYMDKGYEILIM